MGFTYNFNGSNLPKFAPLLAGLLNGTATRNVIMACVGDSETAGVGAGSGNGWPNGRAGSWPMQLPAALWNLGVSASAGSFFGDGNCVSDGGCTAYQFDPRLAGAWSSYTGAGPYSFGGNMFASNGITSALIFTPGVQCDTFDVFDLGSTSYQVSIDGGADINVAAAGSTGLRKTTFSAASLGNGHTLAIGAPAGASTYIIGVSAYNSHQPSLLIYNGGGGGMTTGNWVDATYSWSPLPNLQALNADIIPIVLGTNDMYTGVPLSTSMANIKTIITSTPSSDHIIIAPEPSAASMISIATQEAYCTALYGLANQMNIPLIDLYHAMGSNVTETANGLAFDGEHDNSIGYCVEAHWIARAIVLGV